MEFEMKVQKMVKVKGWGIDIIIFIFFNLIYDLNIFVLSRIIYFGL